MLMKPLRPDEQRIAKELTVNETLVKELFEFLLTYEVNLRKFDKQRAALVSDIRELLMNKKKTLTFYDFFSLILSIMRGSKDRKTISIIASIFNKAQETFIEAKKNKLKNKS